MRCLSNGNELRTDEIFDAFVDVLARYQGRDDFRVCHLSIQDNHLHLIAEASNDRAFDRGMRSLTINLARAVNAVRHGRGPVLLRYHSTVIKTKRYARYAIAYVLGNWRRHTKDFSNGRMLTAKLDRYSSAVSFDGWSRRFRVPEGHSPLPVSQPNTYLLRVGWKYAGPLDPFDVPGPPRL